MVATKKAEVVNPQWGARSGPGRFTPPAQGSKVTKFVWHCKTLLGVLRSLRHSFVFLFLSLPSSEGVSWGRSFPVPPAPLRSRAAAWHLSWGSPRAPKSRFVVVFFPSKSHLSLALYHSQNNWDKQTPACQDFAASWLCEVQGSRHRLWGSVRRTPGRFRKVPEGSGGPLTGRREPSGAWQHHFECQHTRGQGQQAKAECQGQVNGFWEIFCSRRLEITARTLGALWEPADTLPVPTELSLTEAGWDHRLPTVLLPLRGVSTSRAQLLPAGTFGAEFGKGKYSLPCLLGKGAEP